MRHSLSRFVPHTRRGAVIATVLLLTVFAGTALAYYLASGGSGSGSATLGGAPTGGGLTLSVSFANGLTPGGSEQVDVKATNPTSQTYSLSQLSETSITTSAPSTCLASWFQFAYGSSADSGSVAQINGGTGVTLKPGQTYDWNNVNGVSGGAEWGDVTFTDSGTDQSACENKTITINATAS